MKKISIIIAALSSIALTGCLKDTPHTDFTKTGATAEILYSGIEYFSKSSPQNQSYALNFTSDTLTFDVIVNMNSDYPLTTDTKVTLGVDANALTAYNSTSAIQYVAMPAAVYSFPVTTGVIKAGTRQVHFALSFYKSIFDSLTDPAASYMVPITLTDASGVTIASNFATIYPHTIGCPIAGTYNWDFSRWNAGDSTSAPLNGSSFTGGTAVISPISPTEAQVTSGYVLAPVYDINFTASGTTLSNFTVAFTQASIDYMTGSGVSVVTQPQIITADPVHHVYEFYYIVFNGSANRYLKDKFYK